MGKYDQLKTEYPEYISKEQLYKICRMAKETAKYYLDAGIIPCIDNGMKTRRYKIRIDDVIRFLEKRDCGQLPARSRKKFMRPRNCSTPVSAAESADYRKAAEKYATELAEGYGGAMTPRQLAKVVGLSKTVIQRYVLYGYIWAIVVNNQYRIPVTGLQEFILSSRYLDGKGQSEQYRKVKTDLAALQDHIQKNRAIQLQIETMSTEGLMEKLTEIRAFYLSKLSVYPDIMTIDDLENLFARNKSALLSLVKSTAITAIKVKGMYKIPKDSIVSFLEGNKLKTMLPMLKHLYIKMISCNFQEDTTI